MMTRLFFITILLATKCIALSGQGLQNKIYHRLLSADSVILVSHLTTYLPIVDVKTDQRLNSLRLVEKNKVNSGILKEQYHLNKKEIDSIAIILTTANTDKEIVDIKCFIPHHGILIFKNGKCSHFDICFSCRHFVTSKDIKLSDELSDNTWNALESFFRNRNLNYKMPGTEFELKDDN